MSPDKPAEHIKTNDSYFQPVTTARRYRFGLLLAGLLCLAPVFSQAEEMVFTRPALLADVVDGERYKDLVVPQDVEGTLRLVLEGGDGGRVDAVDVPGCLFDNDEVALGGLGARVDTTFLVGSGAGMISPGSTIRFIIGDAGESRLNLNGGDGGSGTGVYLLPPGGDPNAENDWVLLAGAGGGGGGTVECTGLGPLAALNGDDGGNGRNDLDGLGDVRNGADSDDPGVDYGRGGNFTDDGGAGGESSEDPGAFNCFAAGGGGGTSSAGGGGTFGGEKATYRGGGSGVWGGGGRNGFCGSSEYGGGGGGYSGGGAGDAAGGGGSFKTTVYPNTGPPILSRTRNILLSRDGLAQYALTGSTVFRISQDTIISSNDRVLEGDTWIIQAGVVVTIANNVVFDIAGTLENFGTVVNKGTLRNQEAFNNKPGGTIINQTIRPQNFNNIGTLTNQGAFYQCFGTRSGANPVGNPVVENMCYLGPDAHGESECRSRLGGSWIDSIDRCAINSYQLKAGPGLTIGRDTSLEVSGILTIDAGATLNVLGSLVNFGVINNCGTLSGSPPIFNPARDCVQSADAVLCNEIIGGSWDVGARLCRASGFTLESGEQLGIPPGYVLILTGTLTNFGMLDNEGQIRAQNVRNGDGSWLLNRGEMLLEPDSNTGIPGSVTNSGFFDNYGLLDVSNASFTNAPELIEGFFDFGSLVLRCESTYLGELPPGEPSEFYELCEDIFADGFEASVPVDP